MPTTQEEKPAKPRARRKADRRKSKSGHSPQQPAEAVAEFDSVSPVLAKPEPLEPEPFKPEPFEAEIARAVAMEIGSETESGSETVLSGEVLPPEVRQAASHIAPVQAIAQAYDEYAQKSWRNGRLLAERLITARSIDQTIEIHGEFAKQAYANFLAQSEKICVLYGEWAQQFFRPFEKFATGWPRR